MKKPNWKVAAKYWRWKWEHRHLEIAQCVQLRLKKSTQLELMRDMCSKLPRDK